VAEDTYKLQVDVNEQASAGIKKLADATEKAARAEKKFAKEVQDRATAQVKNQKMAAAVEAEVERRNPTLQKTPRMEAQEKIKARDREKAVAAEVARLTPKSAGERAAGLAGGAKSLLTGGGAGMLGKAGPWGAAIAAGVEAFDAGLKKSTAALNIMASGASTQAQKWEQLKQEFVPLYDTVKKFREALDGTTETMARNARSLARFKADSAAAAVGIQKSREFEQPIIQAEERARAYNAFGDTPDMNRYDRSSSKGAQAAAEQDATIGADDARRRAGIEATAARTIANRQKAISDEVGRDADKKYELAMKRADELAALRRKENEPGAARNKAAIDTAATAAAKAQEDAARANVQKQAELQRSKEAQLRAAEAEHAVRQADLAVMQAQLGVLQQREAKMAGLAQTVGKMTQADYEMSKEALRVVREQGIENTPVEIADQAGQIAGDYIAKEREKLGARRLEGDKEQFKGVDDATLGAFEKATLAEVRANVDKVKADVRVKIDLDAKAVANDVVQGLVSVLKEFRDAVKAEVELMRQEFRTAETQRHNTQG